MSIKGKIGGVYKRAAVKAFSKNEKLEKGSWKPENDESILELKNFFEQNKGIKYTFERIPLDNADGLHKWVGVEMLEGKCFGIPSDGDTVLVGIGNEWKTKFPMDKGEFKWSGGCVWDDKVYAFPRTENSFLVISEGEVRKQPVVFGSSVASKFMASDVASKENDNFRMAKTTLLANYKKEHHYGGVCTKDGVVYQPPRSTNHILKTDLKTGLSEKINLIDDKYKVNFRYCGSIIHPNGFIYFLPEKNSQVIKLDPKTDKWAFIGERISALCFDAKVGVDGNIYGYSAYCKGIIKIDVLKDEARMIHEEIEPGAFGTKYGINGLLYSVPGDGEIIYSYDVLRDELTEAYDMKDKTIAKHAGGVTTKEGTIYCGVANGREMLVMKPEVEVECPDVRCAKMKLEVKVEFPELSYVNLIADCY